MATIDALRDLLWQRAGGLCGICQEPVPRQAMHIDHILPRSKKGADSIGNLRPAHPLCNLRRGNGDGIRAWAHFALRLPGGLYAELKARAAQEQQSMNALINALMEAAVRQAEASGELPLEQEA